MAHRGVKLHLRYLKWSLEVTQGKVLFKAKYTWVTVFAVGTITSLFSHSLGPRHLSAGETGVL